MSPTKSHQKRKSDSRKSRKDKLRPICPICPQLHPDACGCPADLSRGKRLLFDYRWTPEVIERSDVPVETGEQFLALDNVARRIDQAILQTNVWATIFNLPGGRFLVRDVRIAYLRVNGQRFREEFVQVLLLEGWRTPRRVWTDEPWTDLFIETVQ